MDSDKIVCAECGAAFDVEVLPDDAEMPAENSVGVVEFSIARRIEVALGDRHGDGIFLDLRFFSHVPKSTCVEVENATLARRKWRILALFGVSSWL